MGQITKDEPQSWGYGFDRNPLHLGSGSGPGQMPPEYPELYRDIIVMIILAGLALMVIAPLAPLSYTSSPMERAAGWMIGIGLTPCVLLILYITHQGYVQALSQRAHLSENGLEVERTIFQRLLSDRPATYPISWIKKAHLRRFPTTPTEFGEVALTSGDLFLISKETYQQILAKVPLKQIAENEYENAETVIPEKPLRLSKGRLAISLALYLFVGFFTSYVLASTLDMRQIQRLIVNVRDFFFIGGSLLFMAQSVISFQFRRAGGSDGIQDARIREKNIYMMAVFIACLIIISFYYVMFHVMFHFF